MRKFCLCKSYSKKIHFYWRVILKVPESCPRIALWAETRMLAMKHRVWLKKLLLNKRIKEQNLSTTGRKLLDEQNSIYDHHDRKLREVQDYMKGKVLEGEGRNSQF